MGFWLAGNASIMDLSVATGNNADFLLWLLTRKNINLNVLFKIWIRNDVNYLNLFFAMFLESKMIVEVDPAVVIVK